MAAFRDAFFSSSGRLRRRTGPYGMIITLMAGVLVLFAALAGCEDEQENEPGLDPAFLTPVSAARQAGLTVYWLGPSFEAGGVLFTTREAKFPEGIEGVPLQGLLARYSSQPEQAGFLDLQLLSRADWQQVKDKVTNPPLPGVTRSTARVDGTEGDLLFLPFGTRPLNVLRLVLDLGEVVVVAQAYSVTAPATEGGGELSPFIKDPDLLVQVMEDLRPYPE